MVLLIDNHGDILPGSRAVSGGHRRCAFQSIGLRQIESFSGEDGAVLLQDGRGWSSVGFCPAG
jgi:hypothetical protein